MDKKFTSLLRKVKEEHDLTAAKLLVHHLEKEGREAKLFLLSIEGERHEDRNPQIISATISDALDWIQIKWPELVITTRVESADYDDEAIVITVVNQEASAEHFVEAVYILERIPLV